ncbi:MAG: aspartate dehydrogenase domain-containing protein, partial [Candidatus Omnitrophota bacterium]
TVDDAVRHFPRNINVAATLAIASHAKSKIIIRILTSPEYTINSHEIDIQGDFGHMVSRTENVICPDNPKTSYLAVLSAIQTLKEFCSGVRVGT